MVRKGLICILSLLINFCLIKGVQAGIKGHPKLKKDSSEVKKEFQRVKSKSQEGISEFQKVKINETFGKLPLYFIQNDGQVDSEVKYYERSLGRSIFFTDEGIYISFPKTYGSINNKNKGLEKEVSKKTEGEATSEYLVIKLINGGKVEPVGEEPFSFKVNYFIGNDPAKWKTDIPTYGKIRYREVYPGIDLVFYGNQRQLEYDIVVKPGGNPKAISFKIEGAKEIVKLEEGDLEIVLFSGMKIVQKMPQAYQEIEGKKVKVSAEFEIKKR